MPHCTTCGIYFNGRGVYCTYHHPYIQDHRDGYVGGYRESPPIRYGTGRFRSSPQFRHRRQRQIGYHGSYDAFDTHDPKPTLARYNNRNQVVRAGPEYDWTPDFQTNAQSADLRPLVTTFNNLTNTNSLAELTYSVSPTGTRSLTAVANLAREQCQVCLQYFPDRQRLDAHDRDFPVSCEVHGVCMGYEDIVLHAKNHRHSRCFVRDCASVYRREGGWIGSVVKKHIKRWHGEGP